MSIIAEYRLGAVDEEEFRFYAARFDREEREREREMDYEQEKEEEEDG